MNKTEHFGLESIDDVASKLLKSFKTKTILFYGEMGVGKTTLISALVKALGGKVKATSPTFSIVNEYKVKDDIVYHFDFYRIENANEALDIGIEDYLYSGHWIFIEWPEKIRAFIPNEADVLQLKLNKNGSRALKLSVYNEISKIN
ncbi:MAG: tRNA (adenosine(37)-N6)-threonylcarbamoyltransferase complex ATPase subunit type 1 TsaE [Flavobacteriaceae bacterium]|nr:tRNA (adenosine(37)-N6)-threonylcarbamoyltransferase complex ATPase subunit type 1 TsaE [Flavobacteriaceae bacterium]